MKVIALYSIKGGVGKTATSVNLSYLAARDGASTLLCDLDPQGASSYYFRVKSRKKYSKKNFLEAGKGIDKNIKGTDYENLDILPADFSYRNLDVSLGYLEQSKNKLQSILDQFQNEYDYIFLDCPPNITLVSENVFVAADCLVVPCIPTTLSLLTYVKLIKFFKSKEYDRHKIRSFFSMVELRKRMHQDCIKKIRDKNVPYFLNSQIPYLADIERMGTMREPVAHSNPGSISAKAYENLWEEIKQKI